MRRIILAEPLTRQAFEPFGNVIDFDGPERRFINGGMTERFHDLARVEIVGFDAAASISLMRGQPYRAPHLLSMVERHPYGSQAFVPLSSDPFLVTVCEDGPDGPGTPRAFLTRPGQGVSYTLNTWHGVLTPLSGVQDFVVVDRVGDGPNLEEHRFGEPWEIRIT